VAHVGEELGLGPARLLGRLARLAQPFGLAGEDRAAWQRLIERTRRAAAAQ
jgi:hypothetical protein